MTNPPWETEDGLFRLFALFDADKDGLISEQEFGELLQTLGDAPSRSARKRSVRNFLASLGSPQRDVNLDVTSARAL